MALPELRHRRPRQNSTLIARGLMPMLLPLLCRIKFQSRQSHISFSTTLGVKNTKQLVYRTAFGVARLVSPRLYSRCACCDTMAGRAKTVSPLAQALPERSHPQWPWLQCRYASVMSFRLAQIFLRDAFSAGGRLAVSSLELNVRDVGSRLEREAQAVFNASLRRWLRRSRLPKPSGQPWLSRMTLATFELRHVQMALDGSPPRWSSLKRRAPMPTPT